MSYRLQGKNYIVGIDEVGRGALAGPVLVVAFALPLRHELGTIKDSKKLTPRGRLAWLERFKSDSRLFWAMASSSPRTIDRENISNAANRAAMRAYLKLIVRYPFLCSARVVLDGGLALKKGIKYRAFKHGDEIFDAVACASIVAKVKRDALMEKLHRRYPTYGFALHKGYGTRLHFKALRRYGPSSAHRLTFLGKFAKV